MDISFTSRGIKVTPPGPAGDPIEMDRPGRLILALRQCAGDACSPDVKVGDQVEAGQVLATGTGSSAADIHSPAAGKIAAIEELILEDGARINALILEADTSKQAQDRLAPMPADPSPAQIRDRIAASGIVLSGRGGRALASVLDEVGAGDTGIAYATVEMLTSGGEAWAYASVVDNSSNDPTTVPVSLQ